MSLSIYDHNYTAGAHEKLSPSSATVPTVITATIYQPTSGDFNGKSATMALITVETDQIRWTMDGTVPAADVGHLSQVGDIIVLTTFYNIKNFRAVKVTNAAVLRVTTYFVK